MSNREHEWVEFHARREAAQGGTLDQRFYKCVKCGEKNVTNDLIGASQPAQYPHSPISMVCRGQK